MGTLIRNGKVLHQGNLVVRDLLITDRKILRIAENIPVDNHKEIDVKGKFVSAGFIDMHVHLCEPGWETKETIATGTSAAARGGFTTIASMPNTRPVIDRPEMVWMLKEKLEKEAVVRVLLLASLTIRQLGEELTNMKVMKEQGIVALSNAGVTIRNSLTMKKAMKRAAELGLVVMVQGEDESLAKGGVVNEGTLSQKYGVKGIPNEAEAIVVARDLLLAEATGASYHVCQISTEQSVKLVRHAKQIGVKVTAEVSPHHLILSDEDILGLDPMYKTSPPLRSPRDRDILIEALKDGTIDMIVTDHTPHTEEEKKRGMEVAPSGIIGLETAFPLLYTHLVLKGEFTLEEIVNKMTRGPAACFGLPWGVLEEGQEADITIIDLETEREVNPEEFASKGKNTPFKGWKLQGWPVMTIVSGSVVWKRDEVLKMV